MIGQDVVDLYPSQDVFARALDKLYAAQQVVNDQIDRCCLHMLYGNGGALRGVLVEKGAGWIGVSLRDPADDPRVIAGEITYLEVTQTTKGATKW